MKELDYLTPDLQLNSTRTVTPGGVMPAIADKTVVQFSPGEYRISGMMIPETVAFVAKERGTVKVTIVPDAPTDAHTPQAFARTSHCMLFYAANIEFEMDWGSWIVQQRAAGGNFKLGCVALMAWQFKLDGCVVRNFGADGSAYGNQGAEVFPVLAKSWAGPGPNETLPTPCIEVCNCVIEDPHFINGGYGTAIHAQTNQLGDRFEMGVRTTAAAHIHHNKIRIPGGIGLGAGGYQGGTEQAIYEYNDIEGKCMFNADTGRVQSLLIQNNKFTGAQGPNLTCSSSNVKVVNNDITITEPFFNAVLGKNEKQWAFRLMNNKSTLVDHNFIRSRFGSDGYGELMIGTYTYRGGNEFLPLPDERVELETNDAEKLAEQIIVTANQVKTIDRLTAELNKCDARALEAENYRDSLLASTLDLRKRLGSCEIERLTKTNQLNEVTYAWRTFALLADPKTPASSSAERES